MGFPRSEKGEKNLKMFLGPARCALGLYGFEVVCVRPLVFYAFYVRSYMAVIVF